MIAADKGRSVVVPGNHDGVHLGHVALLSRAREVARQHANTRVVALTFDPHPLAVLAPARAPVPLTTIERRVELLRRAGADEVAIARFDEAYAQLGADAFVARELVERLAACAVIVGADYRFGHARAGDAAYLRACGARLGFEVTVLDAVSSGAVERVSSSSVRDALRSGDVESATRLLGRPHELEGTVVAGHRRGRTIGFPTANLDAVRVLVPADGVYAVLARIVRDGRATPDEPLVAGMMNVGTRPTLEAGRSIEAHLFDVDRDLYGQTLRVGLVARLRDERRFEGLDALVAQLHRDADHARAITAPLLTQIGLLS